MCGRFTYFFTWSEIHAQLEAFVESLSRAMRDTAGPAASYNAAPKQQVPVLRLDDGQIGPAMMQWWLVPHWSKEATSRYATFNARSETAATTPAFRDSFKRRRCVLPASGFYEWQKTGDKSKQPHYITRADGMPLFFAGLWDCWRDELESCTVLTTTPNEDMRALHDRMPCILEPEDVERWITAPDASLLRPAADGVLQTWPVSSRVGQVRNNDRSLIDPLRS